MSTILLALVLGLLALLAGTQLAVLYVAALGLFLLALVLGIGELLNGMPECRGACQQGRKSCNCRT